MTPDEKLAHYTKPHPIAGRVWFSTPIYSHTPEQALAVIEACELLGVPVTDIVGGHVWLRVADWLTHLEERVQRLEKK